MEPKEPMSEVEEASATHESLAVDANILFRGKVIKHDSVDAHDRACGTHETQAILWPWLEPFCSRMSLKPFKLFPLCSVAGSQVERGEGAEGGSSPEATQRQIDGFLSQLLYDCTQILSTIVQELT